MNRYILAPAAASDLVQIWRYLLKESSKATADRVETVIREKMAVLASAPEMGHWRRDLTAALVPHRVPARYNSLTDRGGSSWCKRPVERPGLTASIRVG